MKKALCLSFLLLVIRVSAAEKPAGSPPNVFLVTVDTLRADHVGCYGYSGVKTPAIDSLAKDGIRFANAFTPVPVTNSSHASIMTGLYPSSHGVTDFGVALSATHVTWAALLQKHGYTTAAFIGAVVLDSKTLAPGFEQGFDYYDNFPPHTGKGHWDVEERRGMEVVQHAEKWLDRPHSEQSLTALSGPRFLWVHLYDPHDPYEPPPPYSEIYRNHLYDGEIAYADHALGDFLAYLRRRGWYDNSLIVLVGDHGEGLGEHKEKTHGIFLYEVTLHVPLLIKLPQQREAGKVVGAQVRTIDILPTVLGLLGMSTSERMDGVSLQPLLAGAAQERERPLFGETDYPLHFGWAPLRCVRGEQGKLIQAPRPEYYDLHADPHELHNLYSSSTPQQQKLQTLLSQHQAEANGGKLSAANAQLPDPKDKIEEENLLHDALLESDRGHSDQARALLKKLLETDSTSALAYSQLGELELKAGKNGDAASNLAKARQLRPEDSTSAFYEGQALFALGDFAGAREALEASLRLLPEQLPARILLAKAYLRLGDPSKAEDQLEAALLVNSNDPDAQLELGRVLLAQKKYAEAAGQLKGLTEQHPSAGAFELLQQAYAGQGKKQLAAAAARRAAELKKSAAPSARPSERNSSQP
jgi:choline-sulfatase